IDPARMRKNLDAGGGTIMAEAAASALTAKMGRAAAHDLVERACSRALEEGKTLAEVLRADRSVRSHLSERDIDRATDAASHPGSAGTFVDRVVARVAALS